MGDNTGTLLSQSGYESRFYKETALIRPLASRQILLSASALFAPSNA